MAVDVVMRHFEALRATSGGGAKTGNNHTAESVAEAIRLANSAIYQVAQSKPEYTGMGSTIVVAVFHEQHLYIGHVGDSRLYRFRNGALTQMTEDHSVVQELLKRGLMTAEEARITIGKNLVTRALGVDVEVIPDVAEGDVQRNDLYLLCSDGLNEVLSDQEIAGFLQEAGKDLEGTTRKMIELANSRGGPDNISVILTRTDVQAAPK
jgi:PPM family protein phosphatase